MSENLFYGWFDGAEQTSPAYDPPHDGPCLLCGRLITPDDVRTISLMLMGPIYAKRSYFYRAHRTCSDRSETDADDVVFGMIAMNGD